MATAEVEQVFQCKFFRELGYPSLCHYPSKLVVLLEWIGLFVEASSCLLSAVASNDSRPARDLASFEQTGEFEFVTSVVGKQARACCNRKLGLGCWFHQP